MTVQSIKVAVLLTCFNRKDMTVSCLNKLNQARDKYNESSQRQVELTVFLTDDNCTDGTAEAVLECMGTEKCNILHADGNAYWAGGMRIAWKAAIQAGDWDFYLLLNDDTDPWDNLFFQLFEAHEFALSRYGAGGIYSGNTSTKSDITKISFGGKIKAGTIIKRFHRVMPNGTPQRCDIVNANILLVVSDVVDKIGIFPECYKHGAADNDYGMRANKAKLPVLVTSGFCGSCDSDNYKLKDELHKIAQMSNEERNKYFSHPVHSIKDKLAFSWRWRKEVVPYILIDYFLKRRFPLLYSKICAKYD